MTFTYDDLLHSPRDQLRLLVGDTNPADPLLSDAEVAYCLSSTGSVTTAAAQAARSIAASFSRLADKSVDGLSISFSQRAASYLTLATALSSPSASASLGTNVPMPVATGNSTAPPLYLGQHSHFPPTNPPWRTTNPLSPLTSPTPTSP